MSRAGAQATSWGIAQAHAWSILDELRSTGSFNPGVLSVLAAHAATVIAERRSEHFVLPPELEAPRRGAIDSVLSADRDWLLSVEENVLAAYVPTLAYLFSEKGRDGVGDRPTAAGLADVASIAATIRVPPTNGGALRIFDPACGTNTLALRVAHDLDAESASISGQDTSRDAITIALANSYLSGVPANIVASNALVEDPFVAESFELAISDPPYGMAWNPDEGVTSSDPRYGGGLPRRSDSALLFAQILASKLRTPDAGGGRAVMFCNLNPLVEHSGSKVRAWMLDQDLLEAVVVLPEALSYDTNIRLFCLVMNNNKTGGWRGRVQVVDLRGFASDTKGRPIPGERRITEQGLDELRKALARPKPSAHARTLDLDRFRFDEITITHPALSTLSRRPGGSGTTLTRWVGRGEELHAWVSSRYPLGTQPHVERTSAATEVRLDVSVAFPDTSKSEPLAEAKRLGWPATRLACLAESVNYVASAKSSERSGQLAEIPTAPQLLMMPLEPHHDAVLVDSPDAAPTNRCLVLRVADTSRLDAQFLTDWLNGPGGRAARRWAVTAIGGTSGIPPRSLSQSQMSVVLDELVVPVPDIKLQGEVARAHAAIRAAGAAVTAAERDLWMDPAGATQIRHRVRSVGSEEDLADWTQRLPYPLAGALWVYETEKNNPPRALEHLLRFWEATAEFLGVVMLSAVESDPVVRDVEFANLRAGLTESTLSLERATFGTWVAVVQRLSSTFRRSLDSGSSDVVSKTMQAFAGLGQGTLERLLSAEVGMLLSTANGHRNDWHGHGGAVTTAQATERLEVLLELTEQLRGLHSTVWEEFRLIRAGSMARRDGRYFVEAELLRTPMAPFRRHEIELADGLDEGRLYLTPIDGDQALALNDFIVLKSSPQSANYTCYFYNRRDAAGVRMITYQLAEESSVVDQHPSIDRLLDDLNTA